jgi:hypothetical protein
VLGWRYKVDGRQLFGWASFVSEFKKVAERVAA